MSKYEDANRIAAIINRYGLATDVSICETGSEVLRIANDRDYGVVICTKRLKDMSYSEIAEMLPNYFGTIVLTKDESLEMASDSMVRLIIPFKSTDLIQTVDTFTHGFAKTFKRNKKPAKRNEEEKKLIDQAKHILMTRNGLSEEEAFRYIQKNSMDYGRKMIESAQMILALYGDE